jgi:hypothetical protein
LCLAYADRLFFIAEIGLDVPTREIGFDCVLEGDVGVGADQKRGIAI